FIVSSVANLRRQASRRASAEPRKSPNSIGLYLVQMPPGERKSGMPDSVEMPAPVKATILLASAIKRFSSSALDKRRPPQATRNAARSGFDAHTAEEVALAQRHTVRAQNVI